VRSMYLAPPGLIDRTKAYMADKHEKAEIMNDIDIEVMKKSNVLPSTFDGHICSIPNSKKLILDNRWLCMECNQRWRVGSRWDRVKWEWVLHWKMYGRDIFTVA